MNSSILVIDTNVNDEPTGMQYNDWITSEKLNIAQNAINNIISITNASINNMIATAQNTINNNPLVIAANASINAMIATARNTIIQDVSAWVWGTPAQSIDDVYTWVDFLVKRDFYLNTSWIYTFSQGNFDAIIPLINNVIDLFFEVNGGDFNTVCNAIKAQFAFGTD